MPIHEWARENVDFSLAPAYTNATHLPYDPDFIPQWKEIVECDTDPDIRECDVIKCSQAGGSENVILNPIRYHVAVDPVPILYMTGDSEGMEAFLEERIKLGFDVCPLAGAKYEDARIKGHIIRFDDMLLAATFPKSKMGLRQFGWGRVYGDEFSLMTGTTAETLRKRTDTFAMSYILLIGSMDADRKGPSRDDPILIVFKQGDQREWFMRDPKHRKQIFKFEMGGPKVKYGLKWSPKAKHKSDGLWDEEKVRGSAYYVTPGGTKIKAQDRLQVARAGWWIPTNKHAPRFRRSYRVTSFGLPFKSGDFGQIAAEWCRIDNIKQIQSERSSAYRKALKVFIYEYLAEEYKDETSRTDTEEVAKRVGAYDLGDRFSLAEAYKTIYIKKPSGVIQTGDVQQTHIWACAREWIDGGDSGLIEYKHVVLWEDFEAMAKEHRANEVFIDCGYKRRKMEVYEYCFMYGGYPTKGSDSRMSLAFKKNYADPFEGKSGQGKDSIAMYVFDTELFKEITQDLVMGRSEQTWLIHQHPSRDYVRQVASEECVNGVWMLKHGYAQNHAWDCEVLQTLGATVEGLLHTDLLARK
jgi:hypothetical protein